MLHRVIVVGPGPGEPGGVGQVMSTLQNELDSQPAPQVMYLSTTNRGKSGVLRSIFVSLKLSYSLLSAKVERKHVLVHLNVASRGSTIRKIVFALICTVLEVPYVCHLHGAKYRSYYSSSGKVMQRVIRSFFQNAKGVIVLGASWADFLTEYIGVECGKIFIVPNGTRDIRTEEAQNPRTIKRIVFTGRLGARKGIPELLTAAQNLGERRRDFEIVLAGDCADDDLNSQARRTSQVTLTGWMNRAQIVRLLNDSDIFVLPSHDEGLPISLLEAMCVGLACVTTPVGAIPEAIESGRSGILIEAGAPKELEEAIAQLIENPGLTSRLGMAARATWEAKFTASAMSKGILTAWNRHPTDM